MSMMKDYEVIDKEFVEQSILSMCNKDMDAKDILLRAYIDNDYDIIGIINDYDVDYMIYDMICDNLAEHSEVAKELSEEGYKDYIGEIMMEVRQDLMFLDTMMALLEELFEIEEEEE